MAQILWNESETIEATFPEGKRGAGLEMGRVADRASLLLQPLGGEGDRFRLAAAFENAVGTAFTVWLAALLVGGLAAMWTLPTTWPLSDTVWLARFIFAHVVAVAAVIIYAIRDRRGYVLR